MAFQQYVSFHEALDYGIQQISCHAASQSQFNDFHQYELFYVVWNELSVNTSCHKVSSWIISHLSSFM